MCGSATNVSNICRKKMLPSELVVNIFFLSFYSGDVVTMECVEKLIKKDMMHPLTSIKLKEKDIIEMQRVCFM